MLGYWGNHQGWVWRGQRESGPEWSQVQAYHPMPMSSLQMGSGESSGASGDNAYLDRCGGGELGNGEPMETPA